MSITENRTIEEILDSMKIPELPAWRGRHGQRVEGSPRVVECGSTRCIQGFEWTDMEGGHWNHTSEVTQDPPSRDGHYYGETVRVVGMDYDADDMLLICYTYKLSAWHPFYIHKYMGGALLMSDINTQALDNMAANVSQKHN